MRLVRLEPADEKDATAILDKAIKALGGEEKLSKVKAYSTKIKGVLSFGGNDSDFTATSTHEGLDHFRSEFEGKFGDNDVKGTTVVNGDKGWRKFGDMSMELEGEAARQREAFDLSDGPSHADLADEGQGLQGRGSR